MRNYPVTAPFDGMVLSRNTNVGDFAGDNTLVEIADLSEVWVELHAIGKAAAKLEAGQPVRVMAATGELEAETRIDRSEEHTSELQSLMRISYAVFCLKKK